MKFTIKKNLLVNCLKNITNLIDTNNLNPRLAGVHIKTVNNQLVFIATNGGSSYQQKISDVKIDEPGDILVKAKFLYNYISKIDQEEITINQIDEKILQINTPKSTSEINLIDNSSFPILNFDHEGWKKITINYDTLLNISQRVKPFTSTNFTNTNLATTGILFNPIDQTQMECVSSDSFRMAYYKFDFSGDSQRFIIEPKAIDMAVDILNTTKNKTIDFYLNQKQCILSVDDINIQFALFNDTYPNIINAILSQQKYQFKIKLFDLVNALNRGSLFISNEQRPIVNLKIENKKLNLKFLSSEIGNEFIQIDILEGNIDNFEIKINQKYLLSLLNTIKSETITFNFTSTTSPIIISSENPYFLNLITPSRS